MALAIVYSRASAGMSAPLVTVEVHLSNGMAGLNIVGLPETAVKESKDRVRSALINSQFEFPCRRITINLAPADLPKEGARFDLAIALGILAASQQIPPDKLMDYEFTGELALSGELRSVRGVLPMVLGAHQEGRQLVVPMHNADEAALVRQATVFSATHLLDVCAHLQGKQTLPICVPTTLISPSEPMVDMADVKGQFYAKRALEIAAAGQHSLLLIGPPGTGKTMLASRLSGILPLLSEEQALEIATITSISHQGFQSSAWQRIPFRAPHHSSSGAALVGGGRPPKPGEISLAHQGVLFLDELPEFKRHVLECLREPLESGVITISRAAFQAVFPARFQLIAAMNPCPCGYAGSVVKECQCTTEQIKRYKGKISGPLLDRIDMQVEVTSLPPEMLAQLNTDERDKSEHIRKRVIETRRLQLARQGKVNAALTVSEIEKVCQLNIKAQQLLNNIVNRFNLSARVYHRILKAARTAADLDQEVSILERHISEVATYRCFDKAKSV